MANIRTARRSGLVLRGGRNRRESLWFFIQSSIQTLANPSTAVLLNSLNAAAIALEPFTVVRVRGVLDIHSDQVAVNEFQSVALGFAVVSQQASAIGVTAIPTPITDQGSDLWLAYVNLMAGMALNTDLMGKSVEYDSRAMRKVEEGQDLVTVAESDIAGQTSGLVVRNIARVLIKLH